jgi:hypothetical protein
MMCNYQNHDVDQDPIIVLPCGHFFATSSLDGHFGMSQVYTAKAADCIEFNGLKPLSDADINEKPRSCPDCRAIAHSIHRYGRVFRLSELRALEIKHWGVIRQELDNCLNLFEKEDTPPKSLSYKPRGSRNVSSKAQQENYMKHVRSSEKASRCHNHHTII